MDVFRKARGDNQEFTMRPPIPGLRGLVIGAAVLVVVIFLLSFVVRVTRIEAGHVGVEINLAGSQRGASEIPVRTGWVLYSPLSTQIIEFPTYVQTVKWTKDVNEGPSTKRWVSTRKRAWKFLSTSRFPTPSIHCTFRTSTSNTVSAI